MSPELKSLAAGMFGEDGIDLAGDAVANVDAASSRVTRLPQAGSTLMEAASTRKTPKNKAQTPYFIF